MYCNCKEYGVYVHILRLDKATMYFSVYIK